MRDTPNLSQLVKIKMRKRKNLLKRIHQPFWIPSSNLILLFIILFLILGLLSHIGTNFLDVFKIKTPIITFESNKYQNLIAINTGIGAILVGITFFVAQSLMDNRDPDRARVLLYKSSFFPLLTMNILIFILLLSGQLNYFIIAIMSFLGFSTIISLKRTVMILIKASELDVAKEKVFFDILRKNYIKILNLEIKKHIGNQILLSFDEIYKHKYNGIVTFNPFLLSIDKQYIQVHALKEGTLIDINFKQLEKLIIYIQNVPLKEEIDGTHIDEENITSINFSRKPPKIIIHPMAYSSISEKSILLEVRKDIIDYTPNLYEYLYGQLNSIFTIESDYNKQEARFEVSKLKDKCFAAIYNQRTGELEKLIKTFENLIIELYKYMKSYGSVFNQSKIIFANHQIKPVEWLFNDLKEIVERGMATNNIHIIMIVAYMPISLAKKAIEYKDHLVFQEYIYFTQLMYKSAKERERDNIKIAEFLYASTERYINELSDFNLIIKYREDNYFSINDFKDFSIYLLKVYQNLLKTSFDNLDLINFKYYLNKLIKLFENIDRKYNFNIYREHKGLQKELDDKRMQVLFGVGSWILARIIENNTNDLKEYFTSILKELPTDIKSLTSVFIELHDLETAYFWGLEKWIEEEYKRHEVYNFHILHKLSQFYIFSTLEKINVNKLNELKTSKISEDLVSFINEESELMRTLNEIKTSPQKWQFVLSNEALQNVEKFIHLLNEIKRDFIDKEQERINQTQVDKVTINLFKTSVLNNYKIIFSIKNILNYYGLVTEKMIDKKFGINIFLNKFTFFNNECKQYQSDFYFGKYIVQSINKVIIEQIEEQIQLIDENLFDEEIKKIVNLNDFIIISVNTKFQYFKRGSVKYKKKINLKEFEGIYKLNNQEILAYEIYDLNSRKEIIILNIKTVGELLQNSNNNLNALSIEVIEESKKVHVQIYERFTFQTKEITGFRIVFKNIPE